MTRVWNSPTTSPPRTLTAPISVMPHSAGLPPVVSRSTTTKVTDDSGVPRSSNVPWTIVMPLTVGSRTDTPAKARWHGRWPGDDSGCRGGPAAAPRHPSWSGQRRRAVSSRYSQAMTPSVEVPVAEVGERGIQAATRSGWSASER